MIGVVVLGLMVLLTWVAMKRSDRPLGPGERRFLILSPLPALVTFGIPTMLALAGRAPAGKSSLADPLLILGLIASGLATGLGLYLLSRSERGSGVDARLVVGLVVAALPMLLTGLVALIYAIL